MIEKAIVDFLNGLPPQFIVVFIAMLPISELRGALPLALKVYGMPVPEAYALSVLGNLIPVPPLLLFLERVEKWLRRFSVFDAFFRWLFARTRRRTGEKIEKYGALGLIPFVAVPLPVTGAWTGVAAAYVFDIRFRYSFPAIVVGVILAGAVVLAATMGVFHAGLISS
ncbi:MAG: small multi-drug export protein [Euryarchaeota archaeon]|nr:small multi-drug export protein [Euryarchaeota archaeon]